MYKNKKDVDKHVESLLSKLTPKEFKTRAFSVARLYFEVGDNANCQKYVEQYLTQKDNNAAAFKLLGQALQKLGQKEKALEHFSTSLDIDPAQTSTILDICELLADNDVVIEAGIAKFWCERAEAAFPRHPIIFRLQERLATMSNRDPESLTKLLTAELAIRPKDVQLHVRLLKHYLQINKMKEAFEHSCEIEFSGNTFLNSYAWYEILIEIVKYQGQNGNDWLFQLFLLTIRERICMLSLTESPSGTSKSLVESCELLHAYDQAIESVVKLGAPSGFSEFHACLLQHHRGQFALHAATYLLKKAKKDQLNWRDAMKFAAPLMLSAWHTVPLDPKVNWLKHSPEKQINSVIRWYSESTYRCSQSGHYLISCSQDRSQTFLDQISQYCSGTHWRDKLYEKIFTSQEQLIKIKSSHFVSNAYGTPPLRLPRKIEVEAYDADAQKQYGNSLHHFVWMLLNYKNYAQFKCTLFDMLKPTKNSGGPETLNKLDIYAFLYCASLTAQQQKSRKGVYISNDKPSLVPANITDLLCSLSQMKWWDCVYKFSHDGLGTELTDIRSTLSRGIEVVRCVDNHGLDPELLCILGQLFDRISQSTTNIEEKTHIETRARLYYSSAIPILEKLKSKMTVQIPEKRMFDYTHRELSAKELNTLIEESKLYVAIHYFNDCDYDKVIGILSNLTSPKAYYYLSQTYKHAALEENNVSKDATPETKSKYVSLLMKAKNYAYKALNKLKETEVNQMQPLYIDTQELIENIQSCMNKMDRDLSGNFNYDADDKYLSDDNISEGPLPIRPQQHLRNLNSTPKLQYKFNATHYRTAVDSPTLDRSHIDQQVLERIESEIKNLHKRDTTINDFMEQTKNWFDENRRFGNQIMSTIHSDIQNTTDQFKLLKISIDQVKDQIDACRNECKDVGELKKQIAELKKEVNKLKKSSSEQTINEGDLYNIEEDYRANENTSNFTSQLPFTPSQVMPPLNQRLVPPFHVAPNPYQLYGQSLYNLYNQYAQFAQPTSVAQPIFDPTRPQVNYTGVYPTPDQMYLDVAHLVPPPTIPAAPVVPNTQIGHTLQTTAPIIPNATTTVSVAATTSLTTTKTTVRETREVSRSLPVNVVITSSDPLPTCTTAPAPVLSVTIPPKHIKGTPHNYQIQMPSVSESKTITPPVFSFPLQGNKSAITSTLTPSINWSQTATFNTTQTTPIVVPSLNTSGKDSLEESKTVVDGVDNFPNTSLNKSRTLSERSNTSVENYDPCPDFKPIIPLPDEVKVRTGEEDETVIFASRAKLFRFADKEWKERGLGEMKLLKHNVTGKVRVLMRREQIHKICANHIISGEMEIKSMKNETKAYFWVANDFADETVVLEKFCIRFKTADIARDFYNTFEKARQECSTVSTQDSNRTTNAVTHKVRDKVDTVVQEKIESSFTSGKAIVGGFTFSSTPTFKPVLDSKMPDTKPLETTPATKGNVFSSLSFKTTTSAPLTGLFNVTCAAASSSSISTQKEEKSSKLNTSDTVDEFEPTIEFKPVVPLPALVDQKTGEEDEFILFEHRAKLLRFDVPTKEWKERGLGNIKLLVHKENNQKVRLLMRREQIMKVCCNHALTKEMIFQKMANMDKAVTWCAKDFSDNELVAETFCLRFKTVQICDDFVEAIKSAQSKMKDESKAAKEEKNVAKQNNQSGFGDKFKPKAGSWNCQSCYTNNLESFLKCGCCEQPRPQTTDVQTTPIEIQPNSTISSNITASTGWGNSFKSKPGSWECKDCLVRNDANLQNCCACNSPKVPIPVSTHSTDNIRKFNFSIIQNDSNSEVKKESSEAPAIFGWGDQFKPKEGTWECNQCLIRNESNIEICSACNSPKDPNTKKSDNSTVKFQFGALSLSSSGQNNGSSTSIFDGTGAHKFKFGIPSTATVVPVKPNPTDFVNDPINSIFSTPKSSTESETMPLNFSVKKSDENNMVDSTPKMPLLPTPQTDSHMSFGANENGRFSFVFKPKTPVKNKSPMKSPKSPGEESDDNEYAPEDEGHHIHFNPVIPMPDKVEVVTGEENEIELYGHRAKLYRFINGEWKERGIGIVKILKHIETGKLRVVMRREQVLKICLNHAFTPEITYTPKDDKTWLFAANDFSEGELSLLQFCLRFATKEIATEFKNAVDKARERKLVDIDSDNKDNNDEKDAVSDDVIFVCQIHASTEEKQKAKELMLPENFYNYKNKEPCRGCRGCREDNDDTKPDLPPSTSTKDATTPFLSTPVKPLTTPFQSPASSMYGTPSNSEKTFDSSIFRTPLNSIGSNMKPTVPSTVTFTGSDTNKENTFNQNASIFARAMDHLSMTESQESKPSTLFGAGDSQSTTAKSLIIAPPKLNICTTPPKTENAETKAEPEPVKPLFSDAKSLFANANLNTSSNKSIFEYSNDKKADNTNGGVRSIFGGDNHKSGNIFGSSTPGSMFGSGAVVGSALKPSPSIFGAGGPTTFGALASQNKESDIKSIFGNSEQKPETNTLVDKKSENNKDIKPLFESGLSYDVLSSTATGSGFQKKANFQWEGAGQQLFGGTRKAPTDGSGDKTRTESGAVDDNSQTSGADEEYDPHYEPIVPLPDKIVVTTGEEDEQKLFGERCKLFRYDHKTREWKERGVGELKILYHPEKNTYRLLLRREQVLKAVLNMLLFMDLELCSMKTSDRAWTFVGMNYAETPSGEQETLAVRFKSIELANTFHAKVTECIRKLQAAAANAVKEAKEAAVTAAPLLRLPKHLQDSARVDSVISSKAEQPIQSTAIVAQSQTTESKSEQGGNSGEKSSLTDYFKQVHFQEPGEGEEHYEDDEEYDHDYDHNDYDAYYNEEEEEDDESGAYYSCDGEATIKQGNNETKCEQARIIVTFDQEIYSPKILVTDAVTGEVMADMLIHTDTEFQLSGESCTWSGTDFTSNDPVEKTVSVNFYDSDIAMRFYDSCETSKAATYSSTDPES